MADIGTKTLGKARIDYLKELIGIVTIPKNTNKMERISAAAWRPSTALGLVVLSTLARETCSYDTCELTAVHTTVAEGVATPIVFVMCMLIGMICFLLGVKLGAASATASTSSATASTISSTPTKPVMQRSVKVQGPVTYMFKWMQPRFQPLASGDFGAWSE